MANYEERDDLSNNDITSALLVTKNDLVTFKEAVKSKKSGELTYVQKGVKAIGINGFSKPNSRKMEKLTNLKRV